MTQTFGFMLYFLGLGLGLAICVLDSITACQTERSYFCRRLGAACVAETTAVRDLC